MNAELTRVVGEGIDGQRVIKLFDGYDVERGRFDFVSRRLRRFAMRTATADAALTPLTQVCISISVGAVIAVALSQANSGALTVGSFASFMAALAQIFDPIKRLTNVAARMQKMLVSAESVFTLIDQTPENDTGTKELPEPVRGKVEFRNVKHRFPDADRDTVNDISFVVEPGQTVALVGRSGSGKTTLVNMLPRFVLADSGSIDLVVADAQQGHHATHGVRTTLAKGQVVLGAAAFVGVAFDRSAALTATRRRWNSPRMKRSRWCRWATPSPGRPCRTRTGYFSSRWRRTRPPT